MLIDHPRGNYSFLKGIAPYSAGAVASKGFEIEHARLHAVVPLRAGFDAVSAHLKSIGVPRQALCGMELRSPRPFTFEGFSKFNAGYIEILKTWNILLDGVNPVARTNVAPEANPPAEPSLYGFSYVVPRPSANKRWPVSFVIAGAGELPEGTLDPQTVIRRGDTSPGAIVEKARFVMELMNARLKELGAAWADVTVAEIYTVHDVHPLLKSGLLPAATHGYTWHYSRPPIVTIEYEMDLRGCRREVVVHT